MSSSCLWRLATSDSIGQATGQVWVCLTGRSYVNPGDLTDYKHYGGNSWQVLLPVHCFPYFKRNAISDILTSGGL